MRHVRARVGLERHHAQNARDFPHRIRIAGRALAARNTPAFPHRLKTKKNRMTTAIEGRQSGPPAYLAQHPRIKGAPGVERVCSRRLYWLNSWLHSWLHTPSCTPPGTPLSGVGRPGGETGIDMNEKHRETGKDMNKKQKTPRKKQDRNLKRSFSPIFLCTSSS